MPHRRGFAGQTSSRTTVDSMGTLKQLFLVATAILPSLAHHAPPNPPYLPLPVTPLLHFPQGSWPETLAFRPNGNLLVNLLASEPSIHQVDIAARCSEKVTTISDITAIAQTPPDQILRRGRAGASTFARERARVAPSVCRQST